MSRFFTPANVEYFTNASSVPFTDSPLTMASRFNSSDTSTSQCLFYVGDGANQLESIWTVATAKGRSYVRAGGNYIQDTSNTWTANVWSSLVMSFANTGTDGLTVYLDGTGTVDTVAEPSGEDRTFIGAYNASNRFSGYLSDVAAWTAALDAAEAAAYDNGCPVFLLRPASLSFFTLPIYGPESGNVTDYVGGMVLTDTNTVGAGGGVNPPISWIPLIQVGVATAAPPGGNAPTGGIYGPLVGPMGGPV